MAATVIGGVALSYSPTQPVTCFGDILLRYRPGQIVAYEYDGELDFGLIKSYHWDSYDENWGYCLTRYTGNCEWDSEVGQALIIGVVTDWENLLEYAHFDTEFEDMRNAKDSWEADFKLTYNSQQDFETKRFKFRSSNDQ